MTDARHLHSVGEIARMLDARALDLCQDLLRGGRRQGREWVARDFSGAPGTELSVCIAGEKQGVWKQFNSVAPLHGDMLEFVRLAVCGGDKVAAIRWAKAWLGIDGGDAAALARTRQAVEVQKRGAALPANNGAEKEKAYRIFRAAKPYAGSVAEAYQRGRGVDLSGQVARLRNLLCHPGLNYWMAAADASQKPQLLGNWPAQVAPVFDFKGAFMAVHCTWLERRADGSVGKAPVPKPKKVRAATRGGFIPLWRGERVDPETGEVQEGLPLHAAPAGQWVDIAESIEEGTSIIMFCPAARVFAGISLANMASIVWPENVEGINFWRQNDKPESKALVSSGELIRVWQRQGKRVRLPAPPPPHKDVNDWLQAKLCDERREA